jgi:LacI family transcriptional regulator
MQASADTKIWIGRIYWKRIYESLYILSGRSLLGKKVGSMSKPGNEGNVTNTAVTLKAVANHLGLSPGTVSSVLNNAPSARHIPQHTRNRIVAAARELNYRPNFFARSLRKQRTYTLGVIVADFADAYAALVIAGIEKYARERDYSFILGVHGQNPDLLETCSRLLLRRGVEGLITAGLNTPAPIPLPTVAVSGHGQHEGVTNIVLNHHRAVQMALQHLRDLGHSDIAFLVGHPTSSDSGERWKAICDVAPGLGIPIRPELTMQIEGMDSSPELGYPLGKRLLAQGLPFTALFAFNDVSAIGAIRAFREAGVRVPEDISVVGFDDILGAAYNHPSLTTVRQPLRLMGELATETLLKKIENEGEYPVEILVDPEFVVRESTAPRSTTFRGIVA